MNPNGTLFFPPQMSTVAADVDWLYYFIYYTCLVVFVGVHVGRPESVQARYVNEILDPIDQRRSGRNGAKQKPSHLGPAFWNRTKSINN